MNLVQSPVSFDCKGCVGMWCVLFVEGVLSGNVTVCTSKFCLESRFVRMCDGLPLGFRLLLDWEKHLGELHLFWCGFIGVIGGVYYVS